MKSNRLAKTETELDTKRSDDQAQTEPGHQPRSQATDKHQTPEETEKRGFPIVGIGASAGGLEALRELLEHLPVDTGMGFVLVSHLDPTHKSILTGLLARTTSLPVSEISDGMKVAPNHVYVIPMRRRKKSSSATSAISLSGSKPRKRYAKAKNATAPYSTSVRWLSIRVIARV